MINFRLKYSHKYSKIRNYELGIGIFFLTKNFQFSTFNFQLSLGVPLRVGLSAISFSAALQKDAAAIPNALGAPITNCYLEP